jgi:hypothetical protein
MGMRYGKYQISGEEKERRRRSVAYATGSMELEGADFSNTPDNVHYEAWINGNLTYDELRLKLDELHNFGE